MVIADAGPLIALARIERLVLLSELFGGVSVTSIVANEVLLGGNFPDASALSLAFTHAWLQRVDLHSPELDQAMGMMDLYQIDAGEASAMVLAQKAQAEGN